MQLKATYRDIWKVGYPIMLGNTAHGITQAVDTAFMARVGMNDLNGALLAGMTFFFLTIIAIGFTRGTQILIARRTGENNYQEVGHVFDQLLIKGVLLTAIIGGGLILFKQLALPVMISSGEILLKSDMYLDVRQWSIPLVVFNLILIAFYTGIGKTKVITIATVVLSLTNLVFDYLLIFGHWGLPEMGIKGAALATVIAEVTGMAVLIGALVYNRDWSTFHLFRFPKIDWPLYKDMVTLSWPIVFQHILGMGAWYLFFLMIEKVGEEELAVSSVIKSIYMVIGIPIWGLASGVNTVISNILGQKNTEQVIPASIKSVHISFAVSFIICGIIFLFPDFFIGLYSKEITDLPETLPTLNVVLSAMMLFSVGAMTMHAVMGIGDTKTLLLFEAISISTYVWYAYMAVFQWELSLRGIWATEFVYWTLITLLTSIYLISGKWKKLALKY
ncbi:MAG: MATE family efflux transporter [Bacteroidetes bacterium]|nr:MATE family efflux transporter [Bacteroidota bacterium]